MEKYCEKQKYYARQKDTMIYEKVLNADGIADTLKTSPDRPWFVRDYGEKAVAMQDGIVFVMGREDFDEKFTRSHDADSCGGGTMSKEDKNGCETCAYKGVDETEEPCKSCCHCYTDKYVKQSCDECIHINVCKLRETNCIKDPFKCKYFVLRRGCK